jgi:hypothetical protein
MRQHRAMIERIEITSVGDRLYRVELHGRPSTTRHRVAVSPELSAVFGLDPDDDERLIRLSFEFLLEREPPTSILNTFDLDVIGRYFPEFEATMRARLRAPAP